MALIASGCAPLQHHHPQWVAEGRRHSVADVEGLKPSKKPLLDLLKVKYSVDSVQVDAKNAHLYSDQGLLQRESARFDPTVQFQLQRMWKLYDESGDGQVSEAEYVTVNKMVQRALTENFILRESLLQHPTRLPFPRMFTCLSLLVHRLSSRVHHLSSRAHSLPRVVHCLSLPRPVHLPPNQHVHHRAVPFCPEPPPSTRCR